MSPTDDGDLLARDAASRQRALAPESFIVEAPAGAGKTELLTQRFLMLLARVEEPEEIVAITFTRKAAAEMRGRILASLALAAGGTPPAEAHRRITYDLAGQALAASRQRGWDLAGNPARLRVTTIDALCAGLARQLPLLSRFGGEPAVVEDAGRHYAEASRRSLALLAEEGAAGDAVAAALAHLDNDGERLGRLLEDMLARRDQWLGYAVNHPPIAVAQEALAALVGRELAEIADVMAGRLPAALRESARYAAANAGADSPIAALADWQEPLDGDPAGLARWWGLAELLLTRDDAPRQAFNKNQGLPAGKESEPHKRVLKACLEELAPAAVAALARVRRLPEPALGEDEWQTVTALAQLLKLAAAELWQVFRQAGEADFVEVAQRALAALGGAEAPTDLALRLDYRIRHLLVDEFQDTSPAQVDLLARLTAGWTPGDGRSLFLVGDPMQSIYRFRKADVGLFLRVPAAGIGGLALERLCLYRNNRSARSLVDWVNDAFMKVFPAADAADAGAIRYRPFAPRLAAPAGAGVTVHALVGPAEDAERREAQRILAIIDATWREDAGRTIAVLVKAKKHLAPLVAEIRRHRPDLRYRAVEIERLSERQAVQDLLALAHALHHRADRVHWLACLRAPWCGLTLADLHALAGNDHLSTVWSLMADEARLARLSADGRGRLLHLRQVLAEVFAQQGRQRPRRWLESAWLALGGAAVLASAADGEDVAALFDLVDRLDAGGRFGAEALAAEAENLFAAADAGADGRLQFMSIHKAKGLEFDTVIVPALQRRPNSGDQPLVLWEPVLLDGLGEGLVAAPLRAGGGREATAYSYLKGLEGERASQEARRLLYVAATRAERALHWLASLTADRSGEVTPPAGSLLELLWPAVAQEFAAAAAAAVAADAADGDVGPGPRPIPPLRRLAVLQRPAAVQAAGGESATPLPAGATDAPADGGLDADVGTLVHRYLEWIARQGLAAWPLERLAALRPAMGLWLARRGHGEGACAEGGERVLAALATTLASAEGRWLLAAGEEAAAELALVGAAGEGAALHVIDRCFVDQGARWIVDYKTGAVAGDPATAAERHRPQLQRYAGLFAAEGRPIRLGVFYTALGQLIELS